MTSRKMVGEDKNYPMEIAMKVGSKKAFQKGKEFIFG